MIHHHEANDSHEVINTVTEDLSVGVSGLERAIAESFLAVDVDGMGALLPEMDDALRACVEAIQKPVPFDENTEDQPKEVLTSFESMDEDIFSPPFDALKQQAFLELLGESIPGPSIRHALSPSQNSEVRTILKDSFTQLQSRILGLSFLSKPRFKDAEKVGAKFVKDAVLSHSLSQGGSEVGVCALRDINLFEYVFSATISNMKWMDDKSLEALAEKFKAKPAVHPAPTPSIFDWFASKPPTQEDIDAAARQVSARFGLDGVGFTNETIEPRQRMRWLEKSAKSLQESCHRLGIEESEFGHRGGVSLAILPPKEGVQGMFLPEGFPGSQIQVDASSPYLASTLTHEFTHSLDHVLGVKAKEKILRQEMTVEDGVALDHPHACMYSMLPLRLQSALPEARQGMENVLSLLSGDSFSTRLSASVQKMAAGGGEAGEAAAGAVMGKERERELRERMDKLTNVFLVHAIGMENMHELGNTGVTEIKSSLRANDDQLLLSTVANITRMPPEKAITIACANHYKANGHLHSFLSKLNVLTNGWAIEKITGAINASLKECSAVAAMVHPANLASKPSPMLEKSVDADIERTKYVATMPYQSATTELMARLVDRPQSALQLHRQTKNAGWQRPLSDAQITRLQQGLSELYQVAGIKVKATGPQLSMGDELSANVVSQVVFKPLDAAAQMAQRFVGKLRKGDSNEPAKERIHVNGP